MGDVRVRFAPSPTGYLHIGGVRTALFNWLFARHNKGQFLLRIEDTDDKRFVQGAADDIMWSLAWVGINWDEGPDIGGPHKPYVQSLRHEAGVYEPWIHALVENGLAYRDFSRAGSDVDRAHFRNLSLRESNDLAAAGSPFCVRLKVAPDLDVSFRDIVRGKDKITINTRQLYDLVLVKSNGVPVYHLAHLVDDHLMGITHVIRGEEWVSSTPYHVLLYQAFGWDVPQFAHLPSILRQDGAGKLSKRKDDAATNRFWERGYLASAMLNYLALQGWGYDDHTEIMTRQELIERFTLERVKKSPARWNPDKLRNMNRTYLKRATPDELLDQTLAILQRSNLNIDADQAAGYLELFQERLTELGQLTEYIQALQARPESYALAMLPDLRLAYNQLLLTYQVLVKVQVWEPDWIAHALQGLIEENDKAYFVLLKCAITGKAASPPLWKAMSLLGRDEVLDRICLLLRGLEDAFGIG